MKKPKTQYYWLGNSAKANIIEQVLSQVQSKKTIKIFDYGCGVGGDWSEILSKYPQISLYLYDPDSASLQTARRKIKNPRANFLDRQDLFGASLRADIIVSFSVLEHVYHREEYLDRIKHHLHPQGSCYLNYDDGHFRTEIDLARPQTWLVPAISQLQNLLAPIWTLTGQWGRYQRRVNPLELEQMLDQIGLDTSKVFYSNLTNFKRLQKTIPESKQQKFIQFWLEVEARLNQDFTHSGAEYMSDQLNLWQVMPSRTLVLKHKK